MLQNISSFYNIDLIRLKGGIIDAAPEVCYGIGRQIAVKNTAIAHYITDRAGLRIECSWLADDGVFQRDISDPEQRSEEYSKAMRRRMTNLDRGIARQLMFGEQLNNPLGHAAIQDYDPMRLSTLLMQQGDFFRRANQALEKFFPGLPTNELAESTLSEDERYWLKLYEFSQGARMITDISRKSLPVQVRQFTVHDLPKTNVPYNNN